MMLSAHDDGFSMKGAVSNVNCHRLSGRACREGMSYSHSKHSAQALLLALHGGAATAGERPDAAESSSSRVN